MHTHFTRSEMLDKLLPNFEDACQNDNNGSPYLRNRKSGRRPQLQSVDIIGLVLFFLKKGPFIWLVSAFWCRSVDILRLA